MRLVTRIKRKLQRGVTLWHVRTRCLQHHLHLVEPLVRFKVQSCCRSSCDHEVIRADNALSSDQVLCGAPVIPVRGRQAGIFLKPGSLLQVSTRFRRKPLVAFRIRKIFTTASSRRRQLITSACQRCILLLDTLEATTYQKRKACSRDRHFSGHQQVPSQQLWSGQNHDPGLCKHVFVILHWTPLYVCMYVEASLNMDRPPYTLSPTLVTQHFETSACTP